jgi:hypothetical protein
MCLILNTIQPELKMVGFKSIKNYYSCVNRILYYLVRTNLKDLLTNLFTTNSYNKHARPKIDQSLPTTVTVDFYLAGISSLDEIAESFTTSGYLQKERGLIH